MTDQPTSPAGPATSPDTLAIVTAYRARTPAWTFTSTSWTSPKQQGVSYSWAYRSPRMNANGLIPDGFDEETLLRAESEYYARQQHGSTIDTALSGIRHSLIQQLAKLHRLISQGKIGVQIPTEVVLKDVTIPLVVGPAAFNPSIDPSTFDPTST